MPPSPALRCSPAREHRMENVHKRGWSLESSVPLKAQDDDLVLFNEMRSSDKDNFLLHNVDDFDDSIAKLRYRSTFRLGISIPARGDNNDLLNTDSDKNDYDWLLTPPDTPLFSSLDDGDPRHANLVPRGRQRSESAQPTSIARPLASDRSHMSNTSTAFLRQSSPHRLSPSHSSSKGTFSSSHHSSPPAALRPTTPSRRRSTSPQNSQKNTLPTARSSTPTKRSSFASSDVSGTRGTSPVRVSHGNSASLKLRSWQTNVPGFSSDPPPNLRTSLPDCSSSHVKGSSRASRNGRHSTSPAPRNRRHSMSPTASRSASSSHSHERDHLSSYSKGSALSSGDDDVDSRQSLGIAASCSPSIGKNGLLVNTRPLALSKKLTKTQSAMYSGRRGFDSAQRKGDHWKTPQNMFRPLLSSVPSSSFYAGKANIMPHSLTPINSLPPTNSNANSERVKYVVPGIECGEMNNSNLSCEHENPKNAEPCEEVFNFDPTDGVPESGYIGGICKKNDSLVSEKSVCNFSDISLNIGSEFACASGNSSDIEYNGAEATCSKCGEHFPIAYLVLDICVECAERDKLLTTGVREFADNSNETDPMVLDHFDRPNREDESPLVEPDGENNLLPPRPRTECYEGAGISLLLHRSSTNNWHVVQGKGVPAMSMLSDPSFTRDPMVNVKHIVGRDCASASSIDLGYTRFSEMHPRDLSCSWKGETESMRSDYLTKSQDLEVLECCSNDYRRSYKSSACMEESENFEDGVIMVEEHLEAPIVGDVFVYVDSDCGSKSESLRLPESILSCDTSGIDLHDYERCISYNSNEGRSVNQEMKDVICRDMYDTCDSDAAVPGQCSDLVSQGKSMIPMSRGLTLEEATDTVLFCSSIVHDLAFKAAALASEKELSSSEIFQPRIASYGSSTFTQQGSRTSCYRRSLKPQKFRRKRSEDGDENYPPSQLAYDNKKIQQVPVPDSTIPVNPDSTKLPKLESKCNCSVM